MALFFLATLEILFSSLTFISVIDTNSFWYIKQCLLILSATLFLLILVEYNCTARLCF